MIVNTKFSGFKRKRSWRKKGFYLASPRKGVGGVGEDQRPISMELASARVPRRKRLSFRQVDSAANRNRDERFGFQVGLEEEIVEEFPPGVGVIAEIDDQSFTASELVPIQGKTEFRIGVEV